MTDAPAIAWLRRDLRLADNPALAAAAAAGGPTIVVFILDDAAADAPGGAARWWLDRSLRALRRALGKRGGALVLRRGDTTEELLRLVDETGAQGVFCNRRYDPHGVAVDTALKETLKARGVAVESANGNLLREPWELKTGGGTFYKVFTPMWRALQKAGPAREAPVPAPKKLAAPATLPASDALENWGLAPEDPNWAEEFETIWTPGEKGAHDRLDGFLAQAVSGYGDNRNRPDCESTSRLSPHLAWGEISPLTIWTTTRDAIAAGGAPEADASTFLSEIAWREFSYTLLFHLPDLKA
ncbi:MAG: deoxyribodipyrimidine photo-lyase, partial [Pseudomonadota bacterium]